MKSDTHFYAYLWPHGYMHIKDDGWPDCVIYAFLTTYTRDKWILEDPFPHRSLCPFEKALRYMSHAVTGVQPDGYDYALKRAEVTKLPVNELIRIYSEVKNISDNNIGKEDK